MSEPVILSLGSINADFQVRVDRRPEVSETLLGRDFVRLAGGKAANVAFVARRLGIGAQLLARVGNDDLAEQALAPLREIGVDLAGVSVAAGKSTGVSMITVPPDGKKGIVLAANANEAWTDDDARQVASAIEAAPAGSVLMVDYEVPAILVRRAVEAAHRRGFAIVLDPSPADRVEQEIFSCIDAVLPNSSEMKTLTGIAADDARSAASAARTLLDRGVKAVCVKLADGGCMLAEDDRARHIAPVPVEVVDTTGAGDAFAGALAVALLERRDLLEAACYGVAASHVAVTSYGSQPAYPTREQLDSMFQRIIGSAHVLQPR